jgi:TatD DNase family protein
VTPHLVDSHCHVQHYGGDELQAVLERARQRNVREFLVPAVRLDEADDLLTMAEREDGLWCSLGVHPHDAASWSGEHDRRRLEDLVSHPRVVAVGECGLDFYYDHAAREVQEAVFREQIEVAMESDLPIIVHNRESNEAMSAILQRDEFRGLRADLHSFAGGIEMARLLAPLGHYFGVSGMVTFPKAENVREALRVIPTDRLLIETDTPYLAPVPHRGRKNEPGFVVEIAERLAQELGQGFVELVELSTGNFRRLFSRTAVLAEKGA